MIRSKNRSVTKLRESSKRARESKGTNRLAQIAARIDSARSASYVRRPVFDHTLEVAAYEIVFGGGPITDIIIEDHGDDQTGLVVNSVPDFDVVTVGDGKPLHLAVSSPIIATGLLTALGPDQVVLMLGSGVNPTEQTTTALEDLKAAGFGILLDDLTRNPQLHPILQLADAVKLDVAHASETSFTKQIAVLKTAGVKLIADRIGSYEELRDVTKLGFDQFQGAFLSRPDGFRKTRVPAGQVATLELITMLQNSEAEISDIADVIRRDVSLSYRVLKVANSAQYSLPRPLGSIEDAVMVVGTKQIISWVGMMCMSRLSGKPSELTRTAMVRARVCEILAEHAGRTDIQRFHIVGLFSVIDALLDVPAGQALGELPLAPEITDAITAGHGIMGEVLRAVVAYEQGDWARSHIVGVDDEAIAAAFSIATLETDRAWSLVHG